MHGTQPETETGQPSAFAPRPGSWRADAHLREGHGPQRATETSASSSMAPFENTSPSIVADEASATTREGACAPREYEPREFEFARFDLAEIWRRPLPALAGKPATRIAIRLLLTTLARRVCGITGIENIATRRDPFILCFNHGTRSEALLVPALLAFLRGGRLVHFFADWNYQLIPVVGYVMRLGEPITVTRKPARPRILNRLRPRYADSMPALERGRWWLERGEPIGIFPEGTVNWNPCELARGDHGAAWLSLGTGVPVVPAGIRFPELPEGQRVREWSRMELEFGRPMLPDASLAGRAGEFSAVKEWHACIMGEISRLSHKTWNPQLRRKKHAHQNH